MWGIFEQGHMIAMSGMQKEGHITMLYVCLLYTSDMGPEGGDGGGTVIAQGTPEEICKVPESYTGQFLKPYLESKNV